MDGGVVGCTASHFWAVAPLTADVRACAVWPCPASAPAALNTAGLLDAPASPEVAAVTMPKLEAETTRKPPAARLTAGRTCAIRMKAVSLPVRRCFCGTSFQYGVAISRISPLLNDAPTIDTQPAATR